jgi:hypothetical protein
MKNLKSFFKEAKSIFIKNAWACWMGAGLGFLGIHLTDISWWVFSIPLIILVGMSKSYEIKEMKDNEDTEFDPFNHKL